MTSNLALDTLVDPEQAGETDVRQSLARQLRPELVNRIDEVVVFRRLARRHLENLLARLLEELNDRLQGRQLRVALGAGVGSRLVAAGLSGPFGGRALRRAFETQVVDAVSDRIIQAPELATGAWILDLDDDSGYIWRLEERSNFYLPPAKG